MADRKPVALDVVGRVMVEMGGDSARIDARGDRIVVTLPDFRSGWSSFRRWGRGPGRRDAIRGLHEALTGAGLTLEVVVGRSTVGVLGVAARGNLASRVLGFGPMEIRLRSLLTSLRKPVDLPE